LGRDAVQKAVVPQLNVESLPPLAPNQSLLDVTINQSASGKKKKKKVKKKKHKAFAIDARRSGDYQDYSMNEQQ